MIGVVTIINKCFRIKKQQKQMSMRFGQAFFHFTCSRTPQLVYANLQKREGDVLDGKNLMCFSKRHDIIDVLVRRLLEMIDDYKV